ncbi:MAG TPA: hypothetical protein VJO14_01485 [Bacteroidota bacterium]|nr:hypothetical protein [Bacteroidota bacterium]
MKAPLSVIIITRDPKTNREIHNRFDTLTGFPRLRILLMALRAAFSI